MQYLVLHDWSIFQLNLTTFAEVQAKITKKQPRMILSAGMQTYENERLRNYESHINDTYLFYVPSQHLSFTTNIGCQSNTVGWP